MRSNIVITGTALVSALGLDVESNWERVRRGECGFGALTALEAWPGESPTGGQAAELPGEYCARLPREVRYLRWTVEAAIRAAGLPADGGGVDRTRVAVVLGTTLHGMRAGGRFFRTGDYGQLRAFLAGDTAAVALEGLLPQGMRVTTCSACSSSLGAIALGATLLEDGLADVVLAGGYDTISEYAYAGFSALRLVTPGALRPFARGREGMKLAEGYAVVVLERGGEAAARGARVVAGLAGWGESADCYHLTRPSPEGAGALAAMRGALASAGVEGAELGVVIAHATGTPDNDAAEAGALGQLLGTGLKGVPVVGLKSHLGHTLGAAGAAELILGTRMMEAGEIPPCANVEAGEIEFERLDVVCSVARVGAVRQLMSSSLGFGGANTCVVLRGAGEAAVVERKREPGTAVISGVGVLLPGAMGNAAFAARLGSNGGELQCDIDAAQLEVLLAARRSRRMSTYVKVSIAAATLAVGDAGLGDSAELLAGMSAILGTTHGSAGYCHDYYSQIVREGPGAANPMLFAEGVPNAAAAHVSLTLGLKGSCQTIIGTRTAGLDALILAGARVRTGAAERVLVVASEEWHATVDEAYKGCRPQRRESQSKGCTCAVAFVVESAEALAARAGGRKGYVRLGGSRCVSANGMPLQELVGSLSSASPEILARCPVPLAGQAASAEPLLALAGSLLGGSNRGLRALVSMDRRPEAPGAGVASALLVDEISNGREANT